MKPNSNKLHLFWREVRRRNVLRSLAIYAGTAFIILEACNMLFPRWGLPDWSIDLAFWLLFVGAFINMIIAWFYHKFPGAENDEQYDSSDNRCDASVGKQIPFALRGG